MKSITHQYPFQRFSSFSFGLVNILGFFIPIAIPLYLFYLSTNNQNSFTLGEVIVYCVIGIFAGITSLFAGNYRPIIISDAVGLHTTFLWKDLDVNWNDVKDIKPLFNIPWFKKRLVIKTNSLTPFHRLYGILYSFSLSPSIIMERGISDQDELIRRIKSSIRKNRKKARVAYRNVHQ